MKKWLIGIALCLTVAGAVQAATEAEKRAAIDNGLAYLAATQNAAGGYWDAGDVYYDTSATGSALLSFLEEKDNWGANAAAYQTVVDKGLNYLLSQATLVPISNQSAGNPDSDGNGYGVKFVTGGANARDTYVTGLALPAIASSGTPNALVTAAVNPTIAARTDGSGPGGAWTYRDVVRSTVDYFAYGQSDPATGVQRGGWRYYANYGNSDQSTTQWPIISFMYAQKMGITAPDWVKTELAYWTDVVQSPGGAAYYQPYYHYGEMNETGALLLEQAFLGLDPSNADVALALDFIEQNWLWGLGSGGIYDGNFGHPYAMWAVYKGLETMIGLDDETTIMSHLHADPGDVDNPDHDWNWWEDYCEYLVNTQLASGAWNGYSSWNSWLATPWYINILAATEIPDGQVPLPGAVLLGVLGLSVAGAKLRRSV